MRLGNGADLPGHGRAVERERRSHHQVHVACRGASASVEAEGRRASGLAADRPGRPRPAGATPRPVHLGDGALPQAGLLSGLEWAELEHPLPACQQLFARWRFRPRRLRRLVRSGEVRRVLLLHGHRRDGPHRRCGAHQRLADAGKASCLGVPGLRPEPLCDCGHHRPLLLPDALRHPLHLPLHEARVEALLLEGLRPLLRLRLRGLHVGGRCWLLLLCGLHARECGKEHCA
mmetsp:Transcript_41104/g.111125  ORF Transcript_41104/g.111125 Transcript_41104/m.111125 type:complete len:232 (+) Transcript_41104:837-1532(+)